MKRILIIPAVLALLLGGPTRSPRRRSCRSSATPSHQQTVSIVAGDTVTWRNVDTRNHQVVSTTGTFASPVLRPNRTYSFTFQVAGTYRYRDALNPTVTGTVRVAGAPPAVTFGTSHPQITYGDAVTLSGQVNSKKAGEQVLLTHQPYGQASPIVLATVITGADGTFASSRSRES